MPFYLQALMLATATSLLSVPLAASETLNDIDCIRNLTKIFEQEQSISDLSIEREYILCPSTNFDIGHVQLFGDGAIVGQFPLVLRPNLHARCGHDGSRSNNCTLTGGTFGVFSTVDLEGQVDLGHVVLKGLTFQSLDVHAIIIGGQHGMVDVIDCAFLDSTNSPLIGLQGFIPTALQRSAQDGDVVPSQAIGSQSLVAPSNRDALPSLDVTFTKCLFARNKGSKQNGGNALIFIYTSLQTVSIRESVFEDNDFSIQRGPPQQIHTLIYNPVGAFLELRDNCFINNQVYQSGLVDASKKRPITERNFVKISDNDQDDRCGFIAIFISETPRRCVETDFLVADSCPLLQSGVDDEMSQAKSPSPERLSIITWAYMSSLLLFALMWILL